VRHALALLGALIAAAAAVLLLLTAVDVQRWQGAIKEDDVRFRTKPVAEDLWQAQTTVPGDPARSVLGLGDDIAYRRVLRSYWLARPRISPFEHARIELARGEAQVKLSDLTRVERDKRRLSQEKNLLGALALAVSPRQDPEQRLASFESAVAYFREAIRLDPSNEDAMYNLEGTLELLRDLPKTFETSRGRQPLEDAALAGLQDTGAGY
jgi:tetratricopeptide (TPR) repeat protein